MVYKRNEFKQRAGALLAIVSLVFGMIMGLYYLLNKLFPGFIDVLFFPTYVGLCFVGILILFCFPILLIIWHENKESNSEIGNYVILITFALCFAVLVGTSSYFLQELNKNSYKIDEFLLKKETDELMNELDLQEKVSNEKINTCKQLYRYVYSYKDSYLIENQSFNKLSERAKGDTVNKYSIGKIEVSYYHTPAQTLSEYRMIQFYILLKKENLSLKIHETILDDFVMFNSYTFVPKADLINRIKRQEEWETLNVLNAIKKKKKQILKGELNVSLFYYIYDSILFTLGNNTGYFKPFTFASRVLEIVKTFFKFFYVGYFLSLLVKRFSKT